jgi:tetratricopeptide (TPR) repeat protein
MALLLHNLAFTLMLRGEAHEASGLLGECLTLVRAQMGADHPQTAFVRSSLARALADEGQLAVAESEYRGALAVFRAKAPEHPKVGEILGRLGGVLLASGRAAEAEPLLGEAVARQERPDGSDALELATTRLSLGRCLLALGRAAEAVPHLEKSLAVLAARRGKLQAQSARVAREALAKARAQR